MIISELNINAGFFSQFFFMLNHYLFAKKNGLSFTLQSDKWLYKSSKGWEDYFMNFDINDDVTELIINDNCQNLILKHSKSMESYSLNEYKSIIKEVYQYNNTTSQKIFETKQKINLLHGAEYDSICIRRGDKLLAESNYIDTSKYIDLLLSKNPNCHTIFLQTDDYNCYLDLQKYILDKNLNIKLITLCNENTKGGIYVYQVSIERVEKASYEIMDNVEYISSNIANILESKPINKMNCEEIYEHTIDLITSVDIVLHSNICVCDYSSNIFRFIKLTHDNSDNVYDVLNPDLDIDMNRTEIPACGNFR